MASDFLGSMKVEIIGDNTKLDKSIKTSQKNTEEFGKKAKLLSKSLSGLFAGIGFAVVTKKLFELGKQAENLFRVQELAETKLDQTLIATGNAAGLTAKQLKDMATGLQEVTTFGDEAIIGAESLLLTFKDIGGEVFPRALESILDVSEAMGQDLKSSTIQIGKALNDPVAGLTALSRVGIQFTQDQKDLIKSFDEAGDKASAQGIILKELESQFGGVSKAVANTADGINKQLNNSYGDLLETIGSVISEGLTPYRANLKLEVEAINDTIRAQILRKKAIAGNATLIENLTLRQLEQAKAERALSQAIANIDAAENQVLNTRGLSEVQIAQITKAKEAAIVTANATVKALQSEVEATTRATEATERQVAEENNRVQANIRLAQGIESVTETTTDGTDATEENTEAVEEATETDQTFYNQFKGNKDDELLAIYNNRDAELETLEEKTDAWQEYYKSQQGMAAENAASLLGFSADLFSQLGALRLADAKQETDIIDANLATALEALDKEVLGEEAYNAETEKLTKEANNAKAKIEYEAETASWRLKKLSALASAAQAIVQGFAQLGPIGGAIAAVGTGIATGIQLAIIKRQKPVLQKFAQGGIVAGSSFVGDNVPILANSGERILTKEDQSYLTNFLKNGNNGATNNNSNTVNINSMFSLGNDSKLNEAAKKLFTPLQREAQRRGASIGGL